MNRLQTIVRLNACLVLAAGVFLHGCKKTETSSEHQFRLKMSTGAKQNAFDKMVLTIFQRGPNEGGLDYDIFQSLPPTGGGAVTDADNNALTVELAVRDASTPADNRKDLVYTFNKNPFASKTEFVFRVNHKPWAGTDSAGKPIPPPQFTVRVEGIKSDLGTDVVIARGEQAIPANVLFAGPNNATPQNPWPEIPNAIQVSCFTQYAAFCNDPGDAGLPRDAGLDAGQVIRKDHFVIENFKLCTTVGCSTVETAPGPDGGTTTMNLAVATVRQGGATISFDIRNRDLPTPGMPEGAETLSDAAKIDRMVFSWFVNSNPNVPGDFSAADTLGFKFDPRMDNAATIATGTRQTYTFDVRLGQTDEDGGPTGRAVAPGNYRVQLRMQAFTSTAPPADPDGGGGGGGGGTESLLRFSERPTASLKVQSPPTLVVDAITIEGEDDIFPGDRRRVSIPVRNTGEATAVDLNFSAVYKRFENGMVGDVPAGFTLEPAPIADGMMGPPTSLTGGSSHVYQFIFSSLRDTSDGGLGGGLAEPNKDVRIDATIGYKDQNQPMAETALSATTEGSTRGKVVHIKGAASVTLPSTNANATMVSVGQQNVQITLKVDNAGGFDQADIETARIEFFDVNNQKVRVAAATDDIVIQNTAGWILQSVTPDPNTVVLEPGMAQGSSQDIVFTFRCGDRPNGQLGENRIEAVVEYKSKSRPQPTPDVVNKVQVPASVSVVFTPGPAIEPANEQNTRYGTSVAGLGLVTTQNATGQNTWPAIAIGAPEASAGTGAVHFFQFVTDMGVTTTRNILRSTGTPSSRAGTAVAALGNWSRNSVADQSNEIAMGRPGQSFLSLFDIGQNQAATALEPLPSSYQACNNCGLGTAVAGNPEGLREPTPVAGSIPMGLAVTKQNRRLVAVGAPYVDYNAEPKRFGLGRIDIFWQQLFSEGGNGGLKHRRVDGEKDEEGFGSSIAVADVNGDGDLDLIVGSSNFKRGEGEMGDQAPRGRVRVLLAPEYLRFPGWKKDRDPMAPPESPLQDLLYLEGETAGERFGSAVAGIGDIDGDGYDDFAVGAPGYSAPDKPQIGRVYVYSGKTGKEFYRLEGQSWNVTRNDMATTIGENFGSSLAALYYRERAPDGRLTVHDYNGDGRPDFAVGAPAASPGGKDGAGAVYVYSAPRDATGKGRKLLRFDGVSARDELGYAVGSGRDLNADGLVDLLVGAPSFVNPTDPNRLVRGRVFVFYGGAFEPFQDPPRLEVLKIDDGAVGLAARTVTVPKTGQISLVPVKVLVRNAGGQPIKNFGSEIVFRHKPLTGQAPLQPLQTTTEGCTNPASPLSGTPARICRKTTEVSYLPDDPAAASAPACSFDATAKCQQLAAPPKTIEAGQRVLLDFTVQVADTVVPEEWQLSLKLPAKEGGLGTAPDFELGENERRKWILQTAAQLQVLTITVAEGNTDLGFTSINRGAPIEIVADILNAGQATVGALNATLNIVQKNGGPSEVVDWSPLGLTSVTLQPGQANRVQARFRIAVEDKPNPTPSGTCTPACGVNQACIAGTCRDVPIRLNNGQEFAVTVNVTGTDTNTGLAVDNSDQTQDALRVIASRASLRIVELSIPSTQRFVSPGQINVPFTSRAIYDKDTNAPPSASLRIQSAGLRFSVSNDQWAVRADTVGRSIGICDYCTRDPNTQQCISEVVPTCRGESFAVNADVPSIIAPGQVTVTGTIVALDEEATDTGVVVRGFSDPLVPESKATVQVLGLGTRLTELTHGDVGFGAAIAPLGDVNNDGRGDFAVSAPQDEGRGSVFFFNGGASSLADGVGTAFSDVLGDVNRKFFGHALAGGYTLNADQTADILVGSPAGEGAFPFAYQLGMSGSGVSSLEQTLPGAAHTQRAANDRAGEALAIGDVNNDGCPDAIVGAPGSVNISQATSPPRSGVVCVRFGSTTFSGAASATCNACGGQEKCWGEGAEGDLFGSAIAAWMPSGNSRFFLAVGAPGADIATGSGTLNDAGRVYIYPDVTCGGGTTRPPSLSLDANAATLVGDRAIANGHFGASLAATRLVSLGTPANNPPEKLTIGSPGVRDCTIDANVCAAGTTCQNGACLAPCNADTDCGTGGRCSIGQCENRVAVGRVYVLSENPDQGRLQVVATGERPTDRFGSVVAAVGDVDGDNVGDIGIGAPGAKFGSLRNGRAMVLSGQGFFTLYQFGSTDPAIQGVGRALAGVGRLNGDTFDDVVVGADGRVFLAAGLERTPGAALRIDSVAVSTTEVSTGQLNVPVTLRMTNIGRAAAFGVRPTLSFRPVQPGPRTEVDGRDIHYTQTKLLRVLPAPPDPPPATPFIETEVTSMNSTSADCSANLACIAAGGTATFKVLVNVGLAEQGLTIVDSRADGFSNAPNGLAVATGSADVQDSWLVKTPPAIEVLRVSSPETVVFQGQREVPVSVKLRNNELLAKPTLVRVNLRFRDLVSNTEVPAGYTWTQLPAATEVPIIQRACTNNAGCPTNETCTANFCTVSSQETTVTVFATLAADAKIGEQEITASIDAPPMPVPAVGPAAEAQRHRWTVLEAGVLEVVSVGFRPRGCTPDTATRDCGTGRTCGMDGLCVVPTCTTSSECGTGGVCGLGRCIDTSLSAGQQGVTMIADVKNTGALTLREVRPSIYYPQVPGVQMPTLPDPNASGRGDLTVPAIEPAQPTEIAKGETKQIFFRLDVRPAAVLRSDGFGRVILDARAAGRDANHDVTTESATRRAEFLLQRPAAPSVERATLQKLIFRGEQKVKLAVTVVNGAQPVSCSQDSTCTALSQSSRCVSGVCSPDPSTTASWISKPAPVACMDNAPCTAIHPAATCVNMVCSVPDLGSAPPLTPKLCFQNPAPSVSTPTCTYPTAMTTQVVAKPLGEGTMEAVTNPKEIAGNTRVELKYQFDVPTVLEPATGTTPARLTPIGTTRLRLVFEGLDKNTGLAINDVIFDDPRDVEFFMNRDNSAGTQLREPIKAPEGAVRFGAAIAAAKVAPADTRRGIVVVSAPESANKKGHVYIYGMTTPMGGEGGAPPAPQLSELRKLEGTSDNDEFGDSVAILRNADGTAKYIAVAAPGRGEQGVLGGGVVYFYDANTYALVNQRNGFEDNLHIGKIAAAGNLDGDGQGVEDLLVGLPKYGAAGQNPGNGRVLVLSGASPFDVRGTPINGPTGSGFGSATAGSGAIGPTGRSGFLIGAPLSTGAGQTGLVHSYSYDSGGTAIGGLTVCGGINMPASVVWGGRDSLFGSAIELLASIDGDACPDIVIGAPGEDVGFLERPGAVFVARSSNGFFPQSPTEIRGGNRAGGSLGAAIVSVGDWNGDGKPEFAVGAPSAPVGGEPAANAFPVSNDGVGLVRVYLGDRDLAFFRAEGNRVAAENQPADSNFGATLAAVDLNEDGILDLVVGAPGTQGGSNGAVYLFQGGQVGGARVRVNSATALGRETLARGVAMATPSTEWPGVEIVVTLTNSGKSKAVAVAPTLTFFQESAGNPTAATPASGITVRNVSVCDGNGQNCSTPAAPPGDAQEIDSESKRVWKFRLDISSVTPPGRYVAIARARWRDALTNTETESTSVSVPEFFNVVQRNALLGRLTGDAATTNAEAFGASVSAADVDGDGFMDLVVGEPLAIGGAFGGSFGEFGKVHVFSGRNLSRRLISINPVSGEGRNRTFGTQVLAARVGNSLTPTVLVTQVDRGDADGTTELKPGAVYAFPLDCSASTCAIKGRAEAGGRVWKSTGTSLPDQFRNINTENFGQGLAWLGRTTIGATTSDFFAISGDNDSPTYSAMIFSIDEGGFRGEQKLLFEPEVDGGASTNRKCGGAIAGRKAGEAGANAVLAISCVDLGGLGASGVRLYTPATGTFADYYRVVGHSPAPGAQTAAGRVAIFGETLALLPDMSGDGIGEVLIGWPNFDRDYDAPSPVLDVGRAEIWRGSATTPTVGTAPHLAIEGTAANAKLGISVANVGDVDGDGIIDFAIGIEAERKVIVYSGLSTETQKRIIMTIDAPDGDNAYAGFGRRVVGVGDVNGDGFGDIAVSAPAAEVTPAGASTPVRGAVYVYSGGHP